MKHIIKQRGVAIITALLIVAIATAVSVKIATDLQLDIRRTGNMLGYDQAIAYTRGAEIVAQKVLKEDSKNNTYDSLNDDWALESPPFPVEGGTIELKAHDLHSCFNINSLVQNGQINPVAIDRFNRLLSNLGLNASVTNAIIDWLDTDQDVSTPGGAEDSFYLNQEKPYFTANTAMLSVTELRMIKGFEFEPGKKQQLYDVLAPHVCAFGVSAPINVNTASAEVLQSLAADVNANSIIEQRTDSPFESMAQFLAFDGLDKKIQDKTDLTVVSEYFLLESKAVIGKSQSTMFSIIKRDADGNTEIISRSQNVL